jgi:transcriptional regulator with XRE-family HTH domain
MARSGRPVERPAHLSREQRLRAQERTRQWRMQTGLNQQRMAAEINVSYPTYRAWENGRDDHAGPTRAQADYLNRALRRLLPSQYSDGEALAAWGWPLERDMTYDKVADLLRFAGFSVPRPQAGIQPSAHVFWPHKVREANLVHGVYALAAAAATRAGMTVHLLLDDMGLHERRRHLCGELESWIRTWVAFASGDDAKIKVGLYSAVLTDDYLAERAWPAVSAYLSEHSSVLLFLLASKAVSPLRFSGHAEQSVLELLRERNSIRSDRLLTALRNWLLFEAEIARLLRLDPERGSGAIITLGGDDERDLWDMWHRGCPEGLSARVQHIFLRTMPVSDHINPWNVPALNVEVTDRHMLTAYLENQPRAGSADLIEWLLRSAVHLPGVLSPGFHDGLDPGLRDVAAVLRTPAGDLSRLADPVARAVIAWLTT